MWTRLFGLALILGIVVIGVHIFSKTERSRYVSGIIRLTRIAPTPRSICFAACLNNDPNDACVRRCPPVVGAVPHHAAPKLNFSEKKKSPKHKSDGCKAEPNRPLNLLACMKTKRGS